MVSKSEYFDTHSPFLGDALVYDWSLSGVPEDAEAGHRNRSMGLRFTHQNRLDVVCDGVRNEGRVNLSNGSPFF